jgi:response regulator RpfG family c-di-GMP phosphodiesterase
MVKKSGFIISKAFIISGILIWLGIAALSVIIIPTSSSDIREMVAYSQIIPILVGAFFFGQAGGLLAALAASMVSGSLIITNIENINSIFIQRVMFQIISFNSVALLTSFLSDQEALSKKQIVRQLERMTALRAIDKAINSDAKLSTTLYILLESLSRLLDVEATAILLFDAESNKLQLNASLGFFGEYPNQTPIGVGEGPLAGRAAQERQTIYYNNLALMNDKIPQAVQGKGIIDYYAVPLIAHGELKGVLEVYDRSPHPDSEWKNYLETLAGQAAIAIHNSYLLLNLHKANEEMSEAYEETLRGWSRALDLRDRETEGHTQRVVAMSVKLAEKMGLQGERLTHFQRGAILHDIGKMGVPDNILLKPGPLSDEERFTMHKHPIYAQMLISPIHFLQHAMLIPYYHHERWDGSGYPLGLRGADIPLEARIFAVVDVWDALRSDRPYRKALSDEETIQYILEQSDKHFDPEVVNVFMKLVEEDYQG